jgi:ADP-ribose pyrophosphatase YjhB (NUDIX family)
MNKLEKASDFRPLPGEANFGPPITIEVKGGVHIAPEIVTRSGLNFYATRWPHGLPRHEDPPNTLRFPHGLLMFGETIQACATRLVKDQLGLNLISTRVLDIDSYLDEHNHWHIEPLVLAEATGNPIIPAQASEIVTFRLDTMPELTYWPANSLIEAIGDHVKDFYP